MEELYRSYLTFLRSMSQGLERLTDLAEKKYVAAQTDDLLTLNDLLNQEQAQSLNFRGLELTRDKLLPKLRRRRRRRRRPWRAGTRPTGRRPARPGCCWSRTCGKWTTPSPRWAAPRPGARPDPDTRRKRRSLRPRP